MANGRTEKWAGNFDQAPKFFWPKILRHNSQLLRTGPSQGPAGGAVGVKWVLGERSLSQLEMLAIYYIYLLYFFPKFFRSDSEALHKISLGPGPSLVHPYKQLATRVTSYLNRTFRISNSSSNSATLVASNHPVSLLCLSLFSPPPSLHI